MNWINKHKKIIFIIIGILLFSTLAYIFVYKVDYGKIIPQKIVYVDSAKTYHTIYEEGKFSDLKKENKALYDSLKKYKKEISYLVQFKYKKDYNTGKVITKYVEVDKEGITTNGDTMKIYEYSNDENDTIHYKLKIGSIKEPNWYQLKARISEKFTLVNRTGKEGVNHLTIDTENKGEITNIDVFKKKEKKKFLKRFVIGPAVTVGYDPISNKPGMVVGASITFDLTK